MERLRKTVNISCLIYFVYGIVSWIDLGTFVPPLPLKPILILGFLIVFALSVDFKVNRNLSYLVIGWLFTLLFSNQRLVELFLNHTNLEIFVRKISPNTLSLSLFFFAIILMSLFIRSKTNKIVRLVLIALLVLSAIIYYPRFDYYYELAIVVMTSILFVINRLGEREEESGHIENVIIVLNGVAILSVIDLLTLGFL